MNDANQLMNAEEMLSVLSLSPNPTAIYTGEEIRMQMVNDAMLGIMGKDRSIVGKPMAEVLPELEGQPFIALLQDVWRSGATYHATEVPAQLVVDGVLQTFYFDFEYKAIPNADGTTKCILHTATEVGNRRKAAAATAQNEERLAGVNADLTRVNDELQGKNETLQIAKDKLEDINNRIVISENRLRAISDSPDIYVSILDENLNHIYVNEAYQQLTGRSFEEFLHTGFRGLLPQNEGDYTSFAFLETHKTGGVFRGDFKLKGTDGTYHLMSASVPPIYDAAGKFMGYVSCAVDVTERKIQEEKQQILNEELQALNEEYRATNEMLHVANDELQHVYEEQQTMNEELQTTNTEMEEIQFNLSAANVMLAESEERFRLAIESSRLATWYMNVETREFVATERLREFFGFYAEDELTYKSVMAQIRGDYRIAVMDAMNAALAGEDRYDIEFPIVGFRDRKVRWAHATGKVFTTIGINGGTFFGAIDDITERKVDEQRKNDFIGMVSHELKTPLTSIHGYLDILQDDAIQNGDATSEGLLVKANRQIGKMTTMINSFLNVSRLESGKIEINDTLFDMAGLIKESEEECLSLYKNRKIVYQAVEPMPVTADRDKIIQVINNLVSNAVKYSPPDTTIHVSCVMTGGMAKVCVADEGIGIKPAEIPKLFDRYYRVQNDSTKSIAGFGIGLYLCAEIISRHGGTIWADSEEGKGSVFCFTLPVVR